MLAGCWLDAGLMLAGCWFDAAGCWLDAGLILAGCWLDAGWLQILAEYACYLKLDENLHMFIEIRPECESGAYVCTIIKPKCESGAHFIQYSSQNARVEHMCYDNFARMREWSTLYMIL
jgi:hypothetical protein